MAEQNSTTPHIAVIIPSYTNSKGLRECLASLVERTNIENVEIIVVANGAPEESRNVDKLYPNTQVVWLDDPCGYTRATNIGIKVAMAHGAEYLVLMNDDFVCTDHPKNLWMDMLLAPFLEDPKVGITGPVRHWCDAAKREFLIFFCVMIRRTMLDEIGILDEIFSPGSGEDTDLCCRAVDSGWKIQQVPSEEPTKLVDKGCEDLPAWKRQKMHTSQFPGYHDGNATFGKIPEIYEPAMIRNHAILAERYGDKRKVEDPNVCAKCGGIKVDGVCIGAADKPNCDGLWLWRASVIDGWFGTDEGAWLAKQIQELPKGARILEIGSWHGRSSRFIADNRPINAQLWCCDTFNGSSGEPEMHGTAHWDRGDHAFQWWWCNLQDHILVGGVVPVRMHSENAAHTFASLNMKFDLIFIDGDHSEEGIKTDVEAWLPLLKEGGLICGHDYYKENEGPYWVHVRQYIEKKFPNVEKAATSIWYVRPDNYAQVVENEHREMLGKWFADVPKDAAILDVGCGNGVALDILREMGFTNLDGLDIDSPAVDSPANVTKNIWHGDMHDTPFYPASFDIIYSAHSLEHAHDPIKALHEFHRILKPDGKLFLILPYIDIIYDANRAEKHCGTPLLGLNVSDNAATLFKHIESAGFTQLSASGGMLRQESEIYLQYQRERDYVYDTFLFNGELEVLEIRLATLYDHVDRFVLVEGTKTHSGNEKPLHFELNKDRFAKYLDKISHVIMDDYPEVSGTVYDQAWARERHQRDSVMHGLKDCKDTDIVLIGDADEIVNPDILKDYKSSQGLCRLKQRMFYYYLNCENKEGWDWQKIAPYKTVKELTPCGVRYPPAENVPLIENAGWHFSFLGDAKNAIKKVSDYAHREFDTPELMNIERVTKLIEEGRDIFGRDLKYEFVEIDVAYPAYVRKHQLALIDTGLIKWYAGIFDGQNEQYAEHLKTIPCDCPQDIREHPQYWNCQRHGISYWWLHPDLEGRSGISGCAMTSQGEQIRQEFHAMLDAPKLPALTVTATISTKDRYHILPLTISAILNQTVKPQKLMIYDDSGNRIEPEQLVETSPFSGLFVLAHDLGIEHMIFSTPREGQVKNHQHALDSATTDLIWRVDDDEIPEPNCLENLLAEMKDGVGAVAGLVHHPGGVSPLPQGVDGSLNDVAMGLNLQWFSFNGGPREVSHLYSTFLYSVEAAKRAGGYPKDLSTIGHREETIFSTQIHRAGFKLIVTPNAKTFHLREEKGGIRSFTDNSLWKHDEQVFQEYLKAWNVAPIDTKLVVLDAGIGDHLLFKGLLAGELMRKYPERKWTLAVCYPSVFEGMSNVTLISIADAKRLVGDRWEDFSLYAFAWKHGKDKQHLLDTMREFWG